ncbi:MAG TPA: cytochrome c oxidase assembly protein [Alphaproteobacteria bacterium]|nr:cytochrome c oxidase assembly protein [Alphaproteobacteria bacterium]
MSGKRERLTASLLAGLVAGMVGLSFAAVPLYRLFCQATGFEGTTQRAAAAPGAEGSRIVTVRFNADVDPSLPWRFEPEQTAISVRVGEQATAYFRAQNLSDRPIVGSAVYNVTPLKSGAYFDKVQCFCFTEQRLEPGQVQDMPVTFFVDPSIVKDREQDDVRTVTLSYTFYRNKDAEARDAARLGQASPPQAARLARSAD